MSVSTSIKIWSRKAHRRLGLGCLLVLLVLSVTGFIQNHPETFQLHDDYLSYEMSEFFYGSEFPEIKSYEVDDAWLSQMEETLYFNGVSTGTTCNDRFAGAVYTGEKYGVSCGTGIVLLSNSGEFEQYFPLTSTPLDYISYVSVCGGRLCISAYGGSYRLDMDSDQLWVAAEANHTVHISSREPQEIRKLMIGDRVHEQYSWEQFVIDLHLGNFGSGWGIIILDLTWISLFIISCTGLYIWLTQIFRKKPG